MRILSGWTVALGVFCSLQFSAAAADKKPKGLNTGGKDSEILRPFDLDGKLKDEGRISSVAGAGTYQVTSGAWQGAEFGVWVPKSYSADKPAPLVVSFHGFGVAFSADLSDWASQAETNGFIVVSPAQSPHIIATMNDLDIGFPQWKGKIKPLWSEHEKSMAEILARVFGSFNIDRKRVLATGFSGGGIYTWIMGWGHPETFTHLCFRSANTLCVVQDLLATPSLVKKRAATPTYIVWGERDHAVIVTASKFTGAKNTPEGPYALDWLKNTAKCSRLKHEIVAGGSHASRFNLAAKWFMEESRAEEPAKLKDGKK